jgi:hypothetical protein
MKVRKQAEARAMELYPVVMWHRPTIGGRSSYEDKNEDKRQAFMKCWEEMQEDKQTCGFCVEPKNEEK